MPDPRLVDLGDDLSTSELLARTGATYRKIDYWTRQGWLHAIGANMPGSGRARRYAPTEAAVARALSVLVPLSGGIGGERLFDVDSIARWVRMGLRGRVPVIPGVELDLDVLCSE